MTTTLQPLFDELSPNPGTKPEDVDAWLPDCGKWGEEHPMPSIPPNPLVFSQEALSQRPGMEWLASVTCTLMVPEDKTDIEKQRQALNTFFEHLEREASLLPQDFSSALSDNGFTGSKFLAFDTETTGLDTRVVYDYNGNLDPKTNIVGFSIATSADVGYYFPLRHTEADGLPNWNEIVVLEFLQKLVDNFLLIIHNAQYDLEILALAGVRTRGFPWFLDTMVLHFLQDVNVKRHGLKAISEQLLGRRMIEISQLFTEMGVKSKIHINFDRLPCNSAFIYACVTEDTEIEIECDNTKEELEDLLKR